MYDPPFGGIGIVFVVVFAAAEKLVITVDAAGLRTIRPHTFQSPAVSVMEVIVLAVPVVMDVAEPKGSSD